MKTLNFLGKVKRGVMVSLFSLLCVTAFASHKVTGVVTDMQQEPLPGVNIQVVGTDIGIISGIDGKFEISLPTPVEEILFSFIGFEPKTVKVNGDNYLSVELNESSQLLEEVVVTGYGGRIKRAKLTNSISSVNKETFKNGIFSNPAQALSGAVPGVKVMQTTGSPRSLPTIVLRGGTNLDGSGSPLVVVDGQLRENMSDINVEDIESMEVLKDAGATAIYGARAANGVILITTKRGSEGSSEITFSSKVGLNYLNSQYDFLNAEDYLYWVRSGIRNSAQVTQLSDGSWRGFYNLSSLDGAQPFGTGNLYFDLEGTPLDGNKDVRAVWSPMFLDNSNAFLLNHGYKSMIDPITGKEIIYSEIDWEKELFNTPALTQDYTVSLSGGNKKGHYYTSFGYNHSQGLPVHSFYKRYTAVVNGDYQITKWLKSITNVNFSHSDYYDAMPLNSEANYFGRAPGYPPTQRKYNAAGELLMGKGNSNDYNPNAIVDSFKAKNLSTKVTLGQSFNIHLYKGLNLKLGASLLIEDIFQESFTKDYPSSGGTMVATRKTRNAYQRKIFQTYNGVLSYKKSFLKYNHIDALVGAEFYDRYLYGFSAAGEGAPTDDFQDLSYTDPGENMRQINSDHIRERIMSFFGRVNYDFKDRYLLSLTFRQDGYSKLINNRWGFFPGASAGWILSEEDFMDGVRQYISFAKVRMSYGVNGNVSGIGAYDLQGLYEKTTNYDGNAAIMITTFPNPGLRWERSNTLEGGFDLGFLNNRFNIGLTVYDRQTVDKFASIPMPGNSGVTSIKSNQGCIQNCGIELDLSANLIDQKDWQWTLAANISYNRNKILRLPDNGLIRNNQGAFQVYDPVTGDKIWVGGYQEGQTPGDIYTYKALGIYRTEEEVWEKAADLVDRSGKVILYGPNAWKNLSLEEQKKGLPIQPGDVIWKDINNDGVIDQFDKEKVGNSIPKWLGGLNTTVRWKNLSLTARMDYALGFYQMDYRFKWIMGGVQSSFNAVEEVKDTWTPDNIDAKYPKYYVSDNNGKNNYNRMSSMFAYNGSYLSFRELILNYSFPSEWLSKCKIKSLDISVTGQNLGYLTSSRLYSPEQTATDRGEATDSGYSLPRSVIFGVRLSF